MSKGKTNKKEEIEEDLFEDAFDDFDFDDEDEGETDAEEEFEEDEVFEDEFDEDEFIEEAEEVVAEVQKAGLSIEELTEVSEELKKEILKNLGSFKEVILGRLENVISNQDGILAKLDGLTAAPPPPSSDIPEKAASEAIIPPDVTPAKVLPGDVEGPFVAMVTKKDRKGTDAVRFCTQYSVKKLKGSLSPDDLMKILVANKLAFSSGKKKGEFKTTKS